MGYGFAILGCGKIAQRHAAVINQLDRLTAVCDIVPEKADALAATYNVPAFYQVEDLLTHFADTRVVSICTPNGCHAEHSLLALRAGFHVLCEKPMCIRTTDGEAMIAAAAAAERELFVVKSTRHNPVILALRQLLQEGRLGKVYSFAMNCVWNRPPAYYANSWKGSLDLDGGTLFTQFSHYTDVLLWLLGEPAQVAGFRSNTAHQGIIAFEDTGALALQLANGVIGTLHYSVNATHKNQEVSLTLVAERATLKIGGAYLNELQYQEPQCIDPAILASGNTANDYGFYQGSMSNHTEVYQEVIKALAGQHNTVTDGREALRTIHLIEQIYQQVKL
jgi:UDP-N-acetyl-2-amino-2-deoxyglucuronate dehydrogenase